jgi:RNA polymerase sigma-32 factor
MEDSGTVLHDQAHDTHQDGLAGFLRQVRTYPLLAAAEERELALAWQRDGDRAALDKLLGSHLRLVVKLARGASGYGLPFADLIAEGNVGLMQAADRFDADMGNRFATYATWWIRAAIKRYVMQNAHIVRLGTTAAQKKLFFNLRRLKARHGDIGGGGIAPDVAEMIADELGIPVTEVTAMDGRMSQPDRSLNAPTAADSDLTYEDTLLDEGPDPEEIVIDADEMARRRALLPDAMAKLSPRERDILTERHLKDERPTLETLSHRYGVSRERIRQIENMALDKFKRAMLAPAA